MRKEPTKYPDYDRPRGWPMSGADQAALLAAVLAFVEPDPDRKHGLRTCPCCGRRDAP